MDTNNLDRKYTDLLQDILDNGNKKGDRTGTGTISLFGREIRHNMSEGFPLLTTKKMAWKSMVVELIWFLKGDTNIKYLVENGCNIWNGDAYKAFKTHITSTITDDNRITLYNEGYLQVLGEKSNGGGYKFRVLTIEEFVERIKIDDEFAKKWGDLGPIYGKQWRTWEYGDVKPIKTGELYPSGEFKYVFRKESIDQFADLIKNLKNNPDSRRLIVNAWNVGEIDDMTLPPCHLMYQLYTRELSKEERYNWYRKSDLTDDDLGGDKIPTRAISLKWTQRSVDTFLGLPFNIASYGLLLQIIAQHVNMVPEELIGGLGDTHLYLNHIDQAKEQVTRMEMKLPTVTIKPFDSIEDLTFEHFELNNYKSHGRIKAPLSN